MSNAPSPPWGSGSGSATVEDNPFFVLGLSTEASRLEVEREGQKLLGMIELGFADALTYATPLGARPRDAEKVRAALAALRDPARRLVAELWARHAPPVSLEAPPPPHAVSENRTAATTAEMPRARARLGWGG